MTMNRRDHYLRDDHLLERGLMNSFIVPNPPNGRTRQFHTFLPYQESPHHEISQTTQLRRNCYPMTSNSSHGTHRISPVLSHHMGSDHSSYQGKLRERFLNNSTSSLPSSHRYELYSDPVQPLYSTMISDSSLRSPGMRLASLDGSSRHSDSPKHGIPLREFASVDGRRPLIDKQQYHHAPDPLREINAMRQMGAINRTDLAIRETIPDLTRYQKIEQSGSGGVYKKSSGDFGGYRSGMGSGARRKSGYTDLSGSTLGQNEIMGDYPKGRWMEVQSDLVVTQNETAEQQGEERGQKRWQQQEREQEEREERGQEEKLDTRREERVDVRTVDLSKIMRGRRESERSVVMESNRNKRMMNDDRTMDNWSELNSTREATQMRNSRTSENQKNEMKEDEMEDSCLENRTPIGHDAIHTSREDAEKRKMLKKKRMMKRKSCDSGCRITLGDAEIISGLESRELSVSVPMPLNEENHVPINQKLENRVPSYVRSDSHITETNLLIPYDEKSSFSRSLEPNLETTEGQRSAPQQSEASRTKKMNNLETRDTLKRGSVNSVRVRQNDSKLQSDGLRAEKKKSCGGVLEVLLERLDGVPELSDSSCIYIELHVCISPPTPTDIDFKLPKQTICDKFIRQSRLLPQGHRIGDCSSGKWHSRPTRSDSHPIKSDFRPSMSDSLPGKICRACQWWEKHKHSNGSCQTMNRRSRPVEVENGYVDLSGTPALDVDLTGMHTNNLFVILSIFTSSKYDSNSVYSTPTNAIGWVWLSLRTLTDPFTALQIPNALQLSPIPNGVFHDLLPMSQHFVPMSEIPLAHQSIDLGMTTSSFSTSSYSRLPPMIGPMALENCRLSADLRFIRVPKSPLHSRRSVPLSSVPLSSEVRRLRTRSHALFGPMKDVTARPKVMDAAVDTSDLLPLPHQVSHRFTDLSHNFSNPSQSNFSITSFDSPSSPSSHHFHCVKCGEGPNHCGPCHRWLPSSSHNSCVVCVQLEKRRSQTNRAYTTSTIDVTSTPRTEFSTSQTPASPTPLSHMSQTPQSLCSEISPSDEFSHLTSITTDLLNRMGDTTSSTSSYISSPLSPLSQMTMSQYPMSQPTNSETPMTSHPVGDFSSLNSCYKSPTPQKVASLSPDFPSVSLNSSTQSSSPAPLNSPPTSTRCLPQTCPPSTTSVNVNQIRKPKNPSLDMVLLSDPGASRSLTNHDNSSSDVDDYIDEKSVSSDSTSYCSIQSPSFSNDIAHVVKIKIISGSLKRESHLDLAIEGSLRSNSKTGDEASSIRTTQFARLCNNRISWRTILSLKVLKSDLRKFGLVNAGDVELHLHLIDRSHTMIESFSCTLRHFVEEFGVGTFLSDSPVIELSLGNLSLRVKIGIEPGSRGRG